MSFSIVLDKRAMKDIQNAIDYYDEKESGLGLEFENTLNEKQLTLESNLFSRFAMIMFAVCL